MKAKPPPPRKSLGQNFLTDPNYIRKIVEVTQPDPSEIILEIGPGRGLLTRALAVRAGRVVAIEVDPMLVGYLQTHLADLDNLELVQADALAYPYEEMTGPVKVVGNLPYYIATPLIFRFLEARSRLHFMVLMLQKEVAQRVVAAPGGKAYGALSVLIQYYTDARLSFYVPRTCFFPRPKVDSAIVTLEVLARPRLPVKDEGLLFRLVKGGFAHRRKFLLNALADAGFDPAPLRKVSEKLGLDRRKRAENLGISDFCRLADALFELEQELC